MKRNIEIRIIILVLFIFFTLSCDLSMGEGQLLVVINTEDINLPESNEIAYFKIVGESGTGETFSRTTTDNSILVENIVPGDWEINVSGYNTSEYTIASALLNTTVYKDHTTTETLYLGNPFALTIEGIPDIVQENDLLTLVAKGAFGTDPLFSWYVNGVEQTESSSTLNYLFSTSGNFTISLSVRYAGDQSHCKQTIIVSEPYTITYHLDGGIAPVSNPSTYKKSSETIALEPPTKNNYRFAGWYLDPEFTNPASETIISGSTGDKQYYATWMVERKLLPQVGTDNIQYGDSVAISENLLLIGTGRDFIDTYVFDGNNWYFNEKIHGFTGIDGGFGSAIDISNTIAICGAYWSDTAYIIYFDNFGNKETITRLVPHDSVEGNRFGYSAAIDNNSAIIGDFGEVNDGIISTPGCAYIFSKNSAGIWDNGTLLTGHDNNVGDLFGISVDIVDNFAIVGAKGSDEVASNSGSVYIFQQDSFGTWDDGKKIIPPRGYAGMEFGTDVAISGDTLLIGSDKEAFIYVRTTSNEWKLSTILSPPDGEDWESFGQLVSINDNTIIIGAPLDSTSQAARSGTMHLYRENIHEEWINILSFQPVDISSEDQFGHAFVLNDNFIIASAVYSDEVGIDTGSVYCLELK